MNVLSTFDGMSCGRIALDRIGIKVNNYYASEINKYSINISNKNYPDIIQLGDITKITAAPSGNINLLLGGSPCQDLSNANKTGKGLLGDKSSLFYHFIRLKNLVRPEYFLLENVPMKKTDMEQITEIMDVEPIMINSSLVSAQSRKRLYWTNIPGITQPTDRELRLIDILEAEVNDKYYHSEAAVNYMDRAVNGGRNHWDFGHHSDSNKAKSACITANFRKGVPYNVIIDRRKVNQLNPFQGCSTVQPRMQHRIFSTEGKSTALTSFSGRLSIYPDNEGLIRRLTPIECERLQTLPDNYTDGVADGHRYEMIGNGWNIETVAHILKNISHARP